MYIFDPVWVGLIGLSLGLMVSFAGIWLLYLALMGGAEQLINPFLGVPVYPTMDVDPFTRKIVLLVFGSFFLLVGLILFSANLLFFVSLIPAPESNDEDSSSLEDPDQSRSS